MPSPKPSVARRRQARKQKREDRLKRKRAGQPFGAPLVLVEFPGSEKMSDVLNKFVAPYIEMATDEANVRTLLAIGVAAWNAALLPEDRRMQAIAEVLDDRRTSASERELARTILYDLIDRKQAQFAAIRRAILDFDLMVTAEGYHINVVSTPQMPPAS
jgi:hypothetical protein